MVNDNLNRYRVSRKLTFHKIVIGFALLVFAYNLIFQLKSYTTSLPSLIGLIGAAIVFLGILYYLNTRKVIEYDDIKHVLYVLDSKGALEFEIPVERIDKIALSSTGFDRLGYSYVFVFRDYHNQKQKFRLFTIPFKNHIRTIIIDTKLKNPNVIIRNWSIG